MTRQITITDLHDPRVDVFRDVRDRDLRGRDHLFMAESELVLRRLLRTPDRLESILLTPQKLERLAEEMTALPDAIPIYVGDLDLIASIAGFHVHRGVLAAGRRPTPEETSMDAALGHLREQKSFTLVLAEGLTNVDNMGALFRNAAAFGVDGILLDPSCCDPLYRKAIRVSMGHALSVPYAISADWPADLDRLRDDWDTTLIAAEITPDARPIRDLPRPPRRAIVMGSEGPGLSSATLACCDLVGFIPMAPGVPSLNVAVAMGCILYEFNREA